MVHLSASFWTGVLFGASCGAAAAFAISHQWMRSQRTWFVATLTTAVLPLQEHLEELMVAIPPGTALMDSAMRCRDLVSALAQMASID